MKRIVVYPLTQYAILKNVEHFSVLLSCRRMLKAYPEMRKHVMFAKVSPRGGGKFYKSYFLDQAGMLQFLKWRVASGSDDVEGLCAFSADFRVFKEEDSCYVGLLGISDLRLCIAHLFKKKAHAS